MAKVLLVKLIAMIQTAGQVSSTFSYHRHLSPVDSNPHFCSALEDDQASTGVPPQQDSTSPMGYFRFSYM